MPRKRQLNIEQEQYRCRGAFINLQQLLDQLVELGRAEGEVEVVVVPQAGVLVEVQRFLAAIESAKQDGGVVRSGGSSPSTSSRASSQSPSASRTGRLKRVGVLFSGAPRPGRAP